MKKEEILALVNELEEKSNVDPLLTAPIIETLRENLRKDIRLESAKVSGKLDRVKALDKIIKTIPEFRREQMAGTFENAGFWCVCDGVRGVALAEKPDLPEVAGMDLLKCFGSYNFSMALPEISELKAHIKIEKAAHKGEKGYTVKYDFGEGLPMVNAEFLLDMMQIFPKVERVEISKEYRPEISPLYFFDETAGEKGILLPMKK